MKIVTHRLTTLAALAGAGAAIASVTPAQALPAVQHCAAVKLNQADKPESNGPFGARNVTARGTSCAAAEPVVTKYVENPYSVDSPSKRTSTVTGFRCTWTDDNTVAQQVKVSCTKGVAKLTFADLLAGG